MLYEIFEFLLKLSFGGLAEFLCLNLCHENRHGFAEDKIHFLLARPQVLQRHIAALFLECYTVSRVDKYPKM